MVGRRVRKGVMLENKAKVIMFLIIQIEKSNDEQSLYNKKEG
jgi:hypothetical protein